MPRLKDYPTIDPGPGLFIPVWDSNTDQQKKMRGGGGIYSAVATSNEERASTTTLEDDPELFIPNVPVGVYMMSLFTRWAQPDGTEPNGFRWALGGGLVNTNLPRSIGGDSVVANFVATTETVITNSSTANRFWAIYGPVEVTTPGTVAFRWAQNVSSAQRTRRDASRADNALLLVKLN